MTRPATAQDWQNIDGLEDFVIYLRLLAADAVLAVQGVGSWRNTTIPDLLAAIDDRTSLSRGRRR